MEVWRKINDRYLVSSYGRVESVTRTEVVKSLRCKDDFKRIRQGKILKSIKKSTGYICCTIDGKQEFVHRLVAAAFLPNPENKPQVNHKDLDRSNNYVENLEWVTAKENTAHAVKSGVWPEPRPLETGVNSIAAKLNEDQVKDIKLMLLNGFSQAAIAKKYNLASTTIGWINKGVSYADVEVIFNGEKIKAPNTERNVIKVSCLSKQGDVLSGLLTISEASKKYNVGKNAIRKAILGYQKSAGGYKWVKHENHN